MAANQKRINNCQDINVEEVILRLGVRWHTCVGRGRNPRQHPARPPHSVHAHGQIRLSLALGCALGMRLMYSYCRRRSSLVVAVVAVVATDRKCARELIQNNIRAACILCTHACAVYTPETGDISSPPSQSHPILSRSPNLSQTAAVAAHIICIF